MIKGGLQFLGDRQKKQLLSGISRGLTALQRQHPHTIHPDLPNQLFNMWQAQVQQEDIRLEAERRVKYRGTACIKLEALHFQRGESRELDKGHVEYLKQCFKKEGCRPLEVSHHIPAVID